MSVSLDRFSQGAVDPQDKPYRTLDSWESTGPIILTEAEIERLKQFDLWEEDEDE